MSHDKKNIMVVLSSPSGAGKTTITKKIQQKFNSFKISVSHTTRKPRSNEVDGVDYNFVSNDKFEQLIKLIKLARSGSKTNIFAQFHDGSASFCLEKLKDQIETHHFVSRRSYIHVYTYIYIYCFSSQRKHLVLEK